jgi:diadenosine tetraphosphate (Ap4A) HIT family hydrolase
MSSCDFKVHTKERKKREPVPCARHTICAPETYYDAGFQKLLLENRRQNKWIFDLMDVPNCPGEKVYHSTDEWLLARDLHKGTDNRYLVVFKDKELFSIRELRARHIDTLKAIVAFLAKWLPEQEPVHHQKYSMYFHYMPSVFQLHMHVSMRKSLESFRAHHMHHVLRNLASRDAWYRDALILCQNATLFKSRLTNHNKMP